MKVERQLLTPLETGEYLGISKKTLANWRSKGTSPKFIKLGNKVFYLKEDLDAWIQQFSGFTSTSQARLLKAGGRNI